VLGSGLLYAGAAVGVSHLVQSTRAGGEYGWALLWAVVAANVCKYPFFEFAPRYAIATGKSLQEGYLLLGKWAFAIFLLITSGRAGSPVLQCGEESSFSNFSCFRL